MCVLEPLKCEIEAFETEIDPMTVAKAYDVDCASILEHGPSEPRPDCFSEDDVSAIFRTTFENARNRMLSLKLKGIRPITEIGRNHLNYNEYIVAEK